MKQKRKQKPSQTGTPEKSIPAAAPLSRKKAWLFRLISLILVPVLFFSTLELGLRCFGYGFSPRAIIQYKIRDKDVYAPNYKFGWRFFPHSIARHFDGFVFDTQKAPDTYRIFVLGASAAAGVPAQAYNFGHMLEVMLDELYPDIDFEVHTIAMPAINSHVVVEIAKDCARYQPDLFVVYLGNNEVVGPYGPGTVFAPLSPSLPMIRANIAVKATRTGQLVQNTIQGVARRGGKQQQQWNGLEMFMDKQVRHDDPALETTYRHFEKNLTDICQIGLDSGAAVIVSNVCSNLKDCPPFASLHRPDLSENDKQSWQKIYQEGIDLESQGLPEQAILKYLEAENIDAAFAELQFRMGRCCWETGDYQKANEKYTNAREYDTLRFRADNRINEIIRTVADNKQDQGIYFADSVKAIDANSPHQIPGRELFYEHVHMTFKGNYIVAHSMLPYIQRTLPAAQQTNPLRALTEQDVTNLLAYTDYERAVYLNLVYESFFKRPPFTTQLDHEIMMSDTKKRIDQQLLDLRRTGLEDCLRMHRQAVQKRPDDWVILFQYSAFLNSGLHDIKAEEAQLRKVIQICPYYSAYLNLGINLHQQAKIKESVSLLNYLLEINPNAVGAHMELASIYRQRREYEKDIEHLLKAISLEPEALIMLHLNLANAYNITGKPDKATEALKGAIHIFPEEEAAPAHALLAYLLYNQRNYAEALTELRHAIKIDPKLTNDPSYATLLQNLEGQVNP